MISAVFAFLAELLGMTTISDRTRKLFAIALKASRTCLLILFLLTALPNFLLTIIPSAAGPSLFATTTDNNPPLYLFPHSKTRSNSFWLFMLVVSIYGTSLFLPLRILLCKVLLSLDL
jgi:hypothetical protein